MRYNYIIFSYNWDYYKFCYQDLIELDNVDYRPKTLTQNYQPICLVTHLNRFLYFLYRIHHSQKLNNIFNIPFKQIWFESYFQNLFKNDKPLCFIFFGRNITPDKYNYIDYLKKRHPTSKYVCFFQDLIATHTNLDIKRVKRTFDLILSYEKAECNKYNIIYHPTVYSKISLEKNPSIPQTDVYFMGAAKDRLKKIYSVFDFLISRNLKCEFYLTGVKPEDRRFEEGLNYIKNMSYAQNLKHISKTKAILEIIQENSSGETLRTWESITNNKKFITNNKRILDSKYYRPQDIMLIDDPTGDLSKIEVFFDNFYKEPNFCYENEFSPMRLLGFIETKLNENKN